MNLRRLWSASPAVGYRVLRTPTIFRFASVQPSGEQRGQYFTEWMPSSMPIIQSFVWPSPIYVGGISR
jgi:hypothetical protein